MFCPPLQCSSYYIERRSVRGSPIIDYIHDDLSVVERIVFYQLLASFINTRFVVVRARPTPDKVFENEIVLDIVALFDFECRVKHSTCGTKCPSEGGRCEVLEVAGFYPSSHLCFFRGARDDRRSTITGRDAALVLGRITTLQEAVSAFALSPPHSDS